MSTVVVLSEDPYIPFPDPAQTLRLPAIGGVCPNLDVSRVNPAEAGDILSFWFPRFKEHEESIGRTEWQQYVDVQLSIGEGVYIDRIIVFAQLYVHHMVRARVAVEDGRDLPFDATCFEKVAGSFREPLRATPQ